MSDTTRKFYLLNSTPQGDDITQVSSERWLSYRMSSTHEPLAVSGQRSP
jgi:hypothetical protein